jgi:ferredoxin-nitrite reductase
MVVAYVTVASAIASLHTSVRYGAPSRSAVAAVSMCDVPSDTAWRRSYDGRGRMGAAVVGGSDPEGGDNVMVTLSPTGRPFSVQANGPTWADPRTGTSFLPEEAIERAKTGNPIEKVKLAKDATNAFTDVYEFAAKVRSGEMDWSEVEKGDMNTRLKWVGLVHRDKRTPGRFMMRLRLPNGITNADSMRFYADSVEPYGPDLGVIDITTRQNIQMRGVTLEDGATIIDGLHKRGQTSLHSALDNVRNMVGSPLAGIDEHEMVDTRPFCDALNDLITLNKETGQRGNPVWCNLPRKFNVAVSGSRDDFAHTHINDIGFQPCRHAKTGEMGFNVVVGGYMSIKRVAESVDMDVWIPADVDTAVELTTAILRIFRDEGARADRQKARLIWQVETYGELKVVDGHQRADRSYRERIVAEMSSYGNGFDKKVDVQQPRPSEPFDRTGSPTSSYLGVHGQPQEGLSRVGIHVPVGRLSVAEARAIADLADKYDSTGEGQIRLTVEQNLIIPNVKSEMVASLLAEPSLNGDSRLSTSPGKISGNLVSCTGSQFCGLALIETKANAEAIAEELEKRVDVPRDVRIHWTGCPNSCGQVQAADIGLMGGPAKKMNAEGKMKAVPGVKIFLGGKLQLDAEPAGIPIEDLVPHLTSTLVSKFGAELKPEFAAEQEAFEKEVAVA